MKRLAIILAMICFRLVAEDAKLAEGFAVGGAELIAKSKIEKGQQLLFKALVYDNNCALALYELGKQFEEEGNLVSAADFLARSVVEFAKSEKNSPCDATRRSDASCRLKKLNPYALQFGLLLEDYAQTLTRINKKNSDNLTIEEIGNRIERLKLVALLPKEKLPFIPPSKADANNSKQVGDGKKKAGTASGIPPDIERPLKSAGWTTIVGAWTKKADNVYEVTDGKLETANLNGAIQVTLPKGSAGIVRVYVRATKSHFHHKGQGFCTRELGEGYGVAVNGQNCKLFTPTQWLDGQYSPWLDSSCALPEMNPKNHVMVTVQDTKLEIFVNGKKERAASYSIGKEGVFRIAIEGTAIIENPATVGKQ